MYMLLLPWEYCIRKGYYYVNHHLSYSYALYAPADYNTLLQSYSENHQTEVGSSLSLPYANVYKKFCSLQSMSRILRYHRDHLLFYHLVQFQQHPLYLCALHSSSIEAHINTILLWMHLLQLLFISSSICLRILYTFILGHKSSFIVH